MKKFCLSVLLFCLSLILVSCGKSQSEETVFAPGVTPTGEGMVRVSYYESQVRTHDLSKNVGKLLGFAVNKGRIIAVGTEDSQVKMAVLDEKGGVLLEQVLNSPSAEEGLIWAITSTEKGFSLLWGTDGRESEKPKYTAAFYDLQGNTTRVLPIEHQKPVIGFAVADEQIYLYDPFEIFAFDLDGEFLWSNCENNMDISCVTTVDGKPKVVLNHGNEKEIWNIDPKSGEMGESIAVSSSAAVTTKSMAFGDTLPINNGDGLTAFYENGSSEGGGFLWSELLLNGHSVSYIGALSENRFACSARDDNSIYVVTVEKREDERKLLTVGLVRSEYYNHELALCANFNNISREYYAVPRYYEQQIQLNTELITGKAPDVLLTISPNESLSGVYVEDLFEFIDSDPDMSRDDFVGNVLEATMVDGKLPSLFSGFYLVTLAGRTAEVGEGAPWSAEEMVSCGEKLGKEHIVVPWLSLKEFTSWVSTVSVGQFVDWNTLTCDFTNEAFISLLEFCKSLPAERNLDNYTGDYSSNILLSFQGLQRVENLEQLMINYSGQEITYKGFPTTSDNNGSILVLPATASKISIPADSKNKSGAWQFIKTVLSDDYQAQLESIPIMQKEFNKRIEGLLLKEDTILTQQDVDKFVELVENTTTFAQRNATIREIILGEATAYFEDDRTVEEAAELIQNRASLYLAEMQ